VAEGAYFAAGGSAATFYNDIDKTMLARMSDMRSTGIYGAAYRLIDVSMAPIKAMTSSAYAEFFRQGVKGPKATSAIRLQTDQARSAFRSDRVLWALSIVCGAGQYL
jgi:O-antigen/teichoic acid export membrane protein